MRESSQGTSNTKSLLIEMQFGWQNIQNTTSNLNLIHHEVVLISQQIKEDIQTDKFGVVIS